MNEDTPLNESTDVVPADSVQETTEVANVPSAGEQLKSLREARGWSIGQVANQLNLASRQIDALERDNYAALPGMVIVRGFIRTYAKLLQVDAAPILAAIKGESGAAETLTPPRSTMATSFSETQLKSDKGRGFPLKTLVLLILVFGAVAMLVFQGRSAGSKTERQAVNSKEAATPVVTQETRAPASSTESSAAVPVSVVDAHEETARTAVSQGTADTESAEKKTPPAGATGKNVLAIHAHQDSWIEIRRANDAVLFSELLKAGASESIELPGPVSVVVGNAAGVDMSLRGKPVDLKGNSSNVARLDLK